MTTNTQWNTTFSKDKPFENFDTIQLDQKIRKIRERKRKLNNVKGIRSFEEYDSTSSINNPLVSFNEPRIELYKRVESTGREGFDGMDQVNSAKNQGSSLDNTLGGYSNTGIDSAKNQGSGLGGYSNTGIDLAKNKGSDVGSTLGGYLQNYKAAAVDQGSTIKEKLSESTIGTPIKYIVSPESLSEDISSILDQISNITSGQYAYYGELNQYASDLTSGLDSNADALKNSLNTEIDINTKPITDVFKIGIDGIKLIFKLIFSQITAFLRLFFKMIQWIILNLHSYVEMFSLKMSSSLTGYPEDYYLTNPGGVMELSTFRKQINQFLTLLLIWVILFNWYYILFFLEAKERFNLVIDSMSIFNKPGPPTEVEGIQVSTTHYTFIYGLIGPALRVPETVNWVLTTCIGDGVQNFKYGPSSRYAGNQIIPNYVLFLVMAFIVILLVAANVPAAIMMDFFNSFSSLSSNLSVTPSILSILSIIIVMIYGGELCFKFIAETTYPIIKESGSTLVVMGAIFLTLVLIVLYIVYILYICYPIGVVLTSAYFFLYTFFGIALYCGFKSGTTVRMISASVFKMTDLLEAENKDKTDPSELDWSFRTTIMSWRWWKTRPMALVKWIKRLALYILTFLFEIIMIVMLLGGIGTYRKKYQAIVYKKALASNDNGLGNVVVEDASNFMKSASKQLFTWLIGINVSLIVLFVVLIRIRYTNIMQMISAMNEKGITFDSSNPINRLNNPAAYENHDTGNQIEDQDNSILEPPKKETKSEEPKSEEPKSEEKKSEEKKSEEKKPEEKKPEEPKSEEKKSEEKKSEEKKSEEPKSEEKKSEEKKPEEPKSEEPKPEESKIENPIQNNTNQPKAESKYVPPRIMVRFEKSSAPTAAAMGGSTLADQH
jgi:outer membrane biosynthesis protein TonB